MKPAKGHPETFATNHKARRDYEILESFEAGLELKGTEIKSVRQRRASIDDSFARIDGGELFLYNMHVSPYEAGNRFNVEPLRARRLLMHRRQIDRLAGLLSQKRVTLVPLRLYEQHGLAKVELAVGKGKRVFEKRDRIRERETDREIQRALRRHRK
ncbi:MAG: SsrA-binding protein SmpB [Candidatus Omnitrophica bacterium]|nr:SsrA-binding protein SmpB [Candidatus Omnitrophota bacterium]MBI3021309.1 SsrA-binding protein SmpB [Candidatus Omnitrophota bacterium]